MRLIIQPDYDMMSKWAAHFVVSCINSANPTPEKPFVLGCPTGSSPIGMYKELMDGEPSGRFYISFSSCSSSSLEK